MNQLSDRLNRLSPSETLAMSQKSNELKAQGIDVINLSVGEPDFNTPDHIKEAAKKAIDENYSRYSPVPGYPALRNAIVAKLKHENNLEYTANQISCSNGAKQCVCNVIMALVGEGDEVIVPAPYWVSYTEMVKLADGTPVIVRAGIEQDFKMTPAQLEAAITPKTKALILCSPSNPTGMVYTREELEALAAVCEKHGLYVLSDDIYYKLVYDGLEYTSIASVSPAMKEQCIVINGVSKTYAMTGWRVGYALANPTVAKAMSSYVSHSTGAPATMAQWAALEALEGDQGSVEEMRQQFEKRRDHLVERMNKIEGVSCIKPQGAFYVMMDMSSFVGKTMYGKKIENDGDFAALFLEKALVATVPCTSFAAPNYLRWSYATSMENIDKGLDRLEKFIAEA